MSPILPSESPRTPIRSRLPAFFLKFGIFGVFLFALVVAVGSFALFGCQCMQPYVASDPVSEKPAAPPPENAPAPSAPAHTF